MSRENQKARSEKVRQEIIDTALEIALKEGFDSVSIRRISNQINYSTGVIYHHFEDKQEIIDAIQEQEGSRLRNLIISVVKPEKGFVYNLKATYHEIMLLAYKEAERYNIVVLNRHTRRKNSKSELQNMLSNIIKLGVEKGEINVADIDRTAFSIWSSFLGFNLIISHMEDLSLEEAEKLFEIQFNIILRGIL